jgi:hypothetical protein
MVGFRPQNFGGDKYCQGFRTSGDIVWSMRASSGSLDRYATARVSDHVLIGGVRHLRQVLASYAAYNNQARTDLALQKDAPLRRSVQRCGQIIAIPIFGLHHQYVRM